MGDKIGISLLDTSRLYDRQNREGQTVSTRKAPCKVNLTLDILGKRPDGYHDLRMVMQTVSLSDTVTAAERPGGFVLRAAGLG